MKKYPRIYDENGRPLPRPGNEERAERRRSKSAALAAPKEYKAPYIARFIQDEENARRLRQFEAGTRQRY